MKIQSVDQISVLEAQSVVQHLELNRSSNIISTKTSH